MSYDTHILGFLIFGGTSKNLTARLSYTVPSTIMHTGTAVLFLQEPRSHVKIANEGIGTLRFSRFENISSQYQ